MAWCLIQGKANDFIKALQKGELDPFKMANMSSEERHSLLSKYVGEENAQNVNSLYESKLLLKDQQAGMINWIKRTTSDGVIKRDLITRISKMDKILNPADQQSFLQDLASQKIGTKVNLDQIGKISDLSSKVQDAKNTLQEDVTNKAKQQNYGRAIYDIQKYLQEIKPTEKSLTNTANEVAGLPRTMVASLDYVSAPFRHGWGSMTDPNWIKNFANIPKLMSSEGAFRDHMAKIYGNPYYDTLIKGGLKISKTTGDLSKQEESFASNLLNKFPITAASKRAFTGFLNGLRFDMASSILRGGELQGKDISPGSKYVKDLSFIVNTLTGTGSLGKAEPAAGTLNKVFFSPRLQVSRVNMFNPVNYLNPKVDASLRITMAKNLIGSLAVSASVLYLAKLAGGKITTNSNSTNFGQVQIGNTKIDVTGGNRVVAILLSRIMSGQYTSSSGKNTTLNQGAYKPLTKMDLVNSFIKGRLAPGAASALADFWSSVNGKDEFGNPVNLTSEAMKQFIPLNITNGMDLFNNDPTNSALGIVLGLLGVPVSSTPQIQPKAPKQSTSTKSNFSRSLNRKLR